MKHQGWMEFFCLKVPWFKGWKYNVMWTKLAWYTKQPFEPSVWCVTRYLLQNKASLSFEMYCFLSPRSWQAKCHVVGKAWLQQVNKCMEFTWVCGLLNQRKMYKTLSSILSLHILLDLQLYSSRSRQDNGL